MLFHIHLHASIISIRPFLQLQQPAQIFLSLSLSLSLCSHQTLLFLNREPLPLSYAPLTPLHIDEVRAIYLHPLISFKSMCPSIQLPANCTLYTCHKESLGYRAWHTDLRLPLGGEVLQSSLLHVK